MLLTTALAPAVFRHSRRGAFVLDHVRDSVPVCNSALDADGETILSDLDLASLAWMAASIALSCWEVVPLAAGALAFALGWCVAPGAFDWAAAGMQPNTTPRRIRNTQRLVGLTAGYSRPEGPKFAFPGAHPYLLWPRASLQ